VKKNVMGRSIYVSALRQELIARNSSYAALNLLPHVLSYGELPVVVYQQSECGRRHGNFISASYKAILSKPQWLRRLQKVHSQGRRSLPATDGRWRELDSSLSSDALLMNIFCYPRLLCDERVLALLGVHAAVQPEFGFRARVPLLRGFDATEVDMRLGDLLVEAKLTETDFQSKAKCIVESYRDFAGVFDRRALPQSREQYLCYQLIRNVLAAEATGSAFCVLCDTRRPDLIEQWYAVMRCVRRAELRTRCKVLTWQELAMVLPPRLQQFLHVKYGIS
jgi:hypothetical protein